MTRPAWRWPGWAAAVVGGLFALLSFAWGLGWTVGISSLGGQVEELARQRDPLILALAWVTGLAKAVGVVVAVRLARGRAGPWTVRLAWTGAGLLVLYGLAQQVGVTLVLTGAVVPTVPPDDGVLWTRALLWEPWFWVWGLLLGLAAWCAPGAGLTRTDQISSSS